MPAWNASPLVLSGSYDGVVESEWTSSISGPSRLAPCLVCVHTPARYAGLQARERASGLGKSMSEVQNDLAKSVQESIVVRGASGAKQMVRGR